MNDQELGKRFSHVYLLRGEPNKDSKKARFRLAKLSEKSCPTPSHTKYGFTPDYNKIIQGRIESELGIKFATPSTSGTLFHRWDWYFDKISITEVLDTITVIALGLPDSTYSQPDRRKAFLAEAQRILEEENLAYRVDLKGGVHPLVDAEFSRNMGAAVGVLNIPRYAGSAACVENVDTCLLKTPQDFVGAIRSVFGACENTFKLMYDVPRLDAKTAGERIGRDQQALYSEHPTLQAASSKMLESFKQWINAAHFYRHEQGEEEPNQPVPEVAILLISQGLSFVRWLASLDKKILMK